MVMATLEDKIAQLPPEARKEIEDFIDFLLLKRDDSRWQLWLNFQEVGDLAEADFGDYLRNLEDYEQRLARGEIQW